jgi:hypothetical protein
MNGHLFGNWCSDRNVGSRIPTSSLLPAICRDSVLPISRKALSCRMIAPTPTLTHPGLARRVRHLA